MADAYQWLQDEECPQCGGPRSECEDPNRSFWEQKHICWRTAAERAANRRFDKEHEGDKPDENGYLRADGVRVWATANKPLEDAD